MWGERKGRDAPGRCATFVGCEDPQRNRFSGRLDQKAGPISVFDLAPSSGDGFAWGPEVADPSG